jgi:hypothetical protein
MYAYVRNQILTSAGGIALSNDFLQEVGNIQMPNYRLLFFLWPVLITADIRTGVLATYVTIGALLFAIGYAFSRQFAATRSVALIAGWWLGVLATPFVPAPFFYNILSVAPHGVLVVLYPALILIATVAIGRSGAKIDIGLGILLVALAWYVLSADVVSTVKALPGIAIYAVTACFLARTTAELRRKLLVLVVVIATMMILLWPVYLWSLLSYTAPYFFPQDFVVDFRRLVSDVSILFDFGWGGPLTVAFGAIGAILSIRAIERERRLAAWVLVIIIGVLLVASLIIPSIPPRSGLPPIKYFEIATWPLYIMFAAVATVKLANAIAAQVLRFNPFTKRQIASEWLMLLPAIAIALTLPLIHVPQPNYLPFPPRTTNIVDRLRTEIGLGPDAQFRGRVATIIPTALPVDPSIAAWDPIVQQWYREMSLSRATGNDHAGPGLWFFQIPTLFEYNALISPAFHALAKRALYSPPIPHLRNNLLLNVPNERIFKLLGVRFVILADPEPPAESLPEIGQLRETVTMGSQRWRLFELDEPNLATYSPTILDVRQKMDEMLNIVVAEDTDLTKRGVIQTEIAGELVHASETQLSLSGGDLRLRARSSGRSLIVVPLEYSRCIEMRFANSIGNASLLRVDGLLTGILFDREVDVMLQFRIGPLHNPLCRLRDYIDLRSLE